MDKRTEILKTVTELENEGVITKEQSEEIVGIVNEYFDQLTGDYSASDLARLMKERTRAGGSAAKDLGAGIAIGIIIGVLIMR